MIRGVEQRGPTCELLGEDSVAVACASCGAAWFYPCVCQVVHITFSAAEAGPICVGCSEAYPKAVLEARAFARRARG